MRAYFALAVIAATASLAAAEVWTTVYRCDETTPLPAVDPNHPNVYHDIMVGTRLVIVVSSDTGEYWSGLLRLSWEDAEYASLSGRGPVTPNGSLTTYYLESVLEAAGEGAGVFDIPPEPAGVGLHFESSWHPSSDLPFRQAHPGDWFIVDYHASQTGACAVKLYDVLTGVEIETLSFTHVPSRDFDGDAVVNFEDFAVFAREWRPPVSLDPGDYASTSDLSLDGQVQDADLMAFSEFWLQRSDCYPNPTD